MGHKDDTRKSVDGVETSYVTGILVEMESSSISEDKRSKIKKLQHVPKHKSLLVEA